MLIIEIISKAVSNHVPPLTTCDILRVTEASNFLNFNKAQKTFQGQLHSAKKIINQDQRKK